ncbi:Pyrophosphatase PpaX [bioreactor metagenome]|uniref:Pyrophosphatase PpaX n=1 Tax=bioreactor metagenome TaxID=1076179 RepID=A0A645IPI8_9ZZZZ
MALDDVAYPKPNEEGILKAMSMLKIDDLNDVLYVGDNVIDYLTALNAGVKSALVVWGPRILDNKVNPDIKIKTFKELLDYVKKP